jgi:hypothetical protein
MGGTIPLGYDVEDRKLVINADEADRVRMIFEQYLAVGCVSKLRENLEQRGIRSKQRVLAPGQVLGGRSFGRGATASIWARCSTKALAIPASMGGSSTMNSGVRFRPGSQSIGAPGAGRDWRPGLLDLRCCLNGGSSNERSRGLVVTVVWLATSNATQTTVAAFICLAMIRIMLRRLAANASL